MRPPRGRSSFNPAQDTSRRSGAAAIGSRLVAVGLVVLGLLVAWRVVAVGFAAFIAAENPALALKADAGQPEALVGQAREALLRNDTRAAAVLSRQALRERPLYAPAYRALAFAASGEGDEATADALMAEATALSRRDVAASSWMFGKTLGEGDYRSAFRHADELLRRSPRYADTLYPRMIAAADQPAAADALVRRLAYAPVWRPQFLAVLTAQASEETLRGVLRRVQASARPLDDLEMAWVLRRYLDRHSRREVRALWAELLAPTDRDRLGLVFDGGFETQPGQHPFSWQATRGASAAVEFEPTGGATGKALHAEHYGANRQGILSQTLVLDPGVYRLSGRVMAEPGGRPDALVWRVSCAGQELLSVRPAEQASGWQGFSKTFTVPAGCDVQELTLEAQPETAAGASAWFDDLRVAPAGAS